MKKIDLHIHTISTFSDRDFVFSLEKLINYVESARIDAIAITNHDRFDVEQFKTISRALTINVFPGIEINLDNGHVLIISDIEDLDEFSVKTDVIAKTITKAGDYISVDDLESIFGDLHDYLVIPHYEKRPAVKGTTLERINKYVAAGEVDSPKKFIRTIKDTSKIAPVLFSDERFCDEMIHFPTRQTYVDCGELTLSSLNICLRDKTKVALSKNEGNSLFQIFDDGQKLSTGLNILLGERSTGKTYTLNRIYETSESTKYIRQFSLVQADDIAYERKFNEDVARQRSLYAEEYLSPFKSVLDDVINIDVSQNEKLIGRYVDTLLQSAEEYEKKDSFSKTALFDETAFKTSEDRVLTDLINSVRQVIENVEYRSIIEKHLDMESLKRLACELIEVLWKKKYDKKKRIYVNNIVKDVKEILRLRTSATQIEDVDLYRTTMDSKAIEKFIEIAKHLQKVSIISEESVQGFRVVARKGPFMGAGEIKLVSGLRVAFSDAYSKYCDPHDYLLMLKENESLTPSEFYKYFVKIDYMILNRDGNEVSGGERSEFRLLQEIKDAQKYEMLLIDEPESSFDNIFLKAEVNQLIKEISLIMPVVVVTHNSTVGASINADYLVYASKEVEGEGIKYRLYSGYPTDKELVALDGKRRCNFDVTMDSLEAGNAAYDERRQGYESIKD